VQGANVQRANVQRATWDNWRREAGNARSVKYIEGAVQVQGAGADVVQA
jgi:hypothetical protein